MALIGRALVCLLLLISTVAVVAVAEAAPTCLGRDATIVGTDKDETLRGTNESDVIYGGGGNDRLDGRGGRDFLCGAGGADTLLPPTAEVLGTREFFDGGPGTDVITYAGSDFNSVIAVLGGQNGQGFAFSSYYTIIKNIEDLVGTDFDDLVGGGPGPNAISLGKGNDIYMWHPADTGQNAVTGGDGKDTANFSRSYAGVTIDLGGTFSAPSASGLLNGFEDATGSLFNDTITGTGSDNKLLSSPYDYTWDGGSLSGLGGADILQGANGNDTYTGGDGDDQLKDHGFGNNTFDAGSGNDSVSTASYHTNYVSPFTSQITGGDGNDSLSGAGGADQIAGGAGTDQLYGRAGADNLSGDADNDAVYGDGENDTVLGGGGVDNINGGPGTDSCPDYDSTIEFAYGCNGGTLTDSDIGSPSEPVAQHDVSVTLFQRVNKDKGEQIFTLTMTNGGPSTSYGLATIFLPGSDIISTKTTAGNGGCSLFLGNVLLFERQAFCSIGSQVVAGESATYEIVTDLTEAGAWDAVVAHAMPINAGYDTNLSNNTVVIGAESGEEEPPPGCPGGDPTACRILLTGPEFVERGDEFTLTATLAPCPAEAGKGVGLLREVSGVYGLLQKATSNSDCKAAFKVRIRKDTMFKAQTPATDPKATSDVVSVKVRPVPARGQRR